MSERSERTMDTGIVEAPCAETLTGAASGALLVSDLLTLAVHQ